MPICKKCNTEFPNRLIIDGFVKILCKRKYCLTCSPFGKYNSRQLTDNPTKEQKKSFCKLCNREYLYDRTKGHRGTQCNSCSVRKSQRKKKQNFVNHFGGKCSKCGYDRCVNALEFHHNGDVDKEDSPSNVIMHWSWDRALDELSKCILVCSNCHREIHHNEYVGKHNNFGL